MACFRWSSIRGLFDPETIGYLLRPHLTDHPVSDFQDWARGVHWQWLAAVLEAAHGRVHIGAVLKVGGVADVVAEVMAGVRVAEPGAFVVDAELVRLPGRLGADGLGGLAFPGEFVFAGQGFPVAALVPGRPGLVIRLQTRPELGHLAPGSCSGSAPRPGESPRRGPAKCPRPPGPPRQSSIPAKHVPCAAGAAPGPGVLCRGVTATALWLLVPGVGLPPDRVAARTPPVNLTIRH